MKKQTDDFLKYPPQTNLDRVCICITQEPDSCTSDDDLTEYSFAFEMKTDNAGGGNFMVIRTDRWAIDDESQIDDLCNLMKEFLRKINPEEKNEEKT